MENKKYFNFNKKQIIKIKTIAINKPSLPKPQWIKIKPPTNFQTITKIKNILRNNKLHTVCEEASCPNITECFHQGTATFMILGSICTRKCPFCNVAHGRPYLPNPDEPINLANTIKSMGLRYVVITSVNRDDMHDGGAQHFINCIIAIRKINPAIKIEILVPDFRGRIDIALNIINNNPPDVFNHNIENVPRMYKIMRPGANYNNSLNLLKQFKKNQPNIPTKSGLMVGIGETNQEIINVIHDLKNVGVTMLTIGQYLQPSIYHLPVKRYVTLEEFHWIKMQAIKIGFNHVESGPLVRSSYHADLQFNKQNTPQDII
uniref:Lipoyl synthase n=1 Tax=Candidatus Aschnera chinzeii TaxID=1485666 RepID=A0AAT9G582_9ENTR|nr:MAG: lipoyl synthase [Candidatus Aschnera chinzeii]